MTARNPSKKPPMGVFIAAMILIFCATLSAADSVGFVPYYIDGTDPSAANLAAVDSHDLALSQLPELGITDSSDGSADAALAAAAKAAQVSSAYPVHISISSVGIDLPVQNPSTTDVDALDALLANGPARYADSSMLGQSGTMVIFAHSSHLPIVHNKMYQAFNQIPNVKAGDIITLTGSDGKNYLYSVDSVAKADTGDGTEIPLVGSGTKLVLVTCDTLTGVSARFVLTATFVGTE